MDREVDHPASRQAQDAQHLAGPGLATADDCDRMEIAGLCYVQ